MIKSLGNNKSIRETALCLAGVVVATFLFFLPFLLQGRVLICHDATTYGLPIMNYVRQMAQAGKFFKWNPYLFLGLPTVVTSGGNAFYPLNVFFALFKPMDYLLYYFILHQVLAAVCAFFYLKRHRFSLLSCSVGAFLFAFSAARIHFAVNLEYYAILTFSPLILLTIDKFLDEFSMRSFLYLVLALALVVLGGGVHFLLLYMLIFVLYGLLQARASKKLFKLKTALSIISVALIVFCLTAVLIIPFAFEFKRQGPTRTIPFNYQQATSGSVSATTLLIAPFANFYGSVESLIHKTGNMGAWEQIQVVGIAGLFLSMVAFSVPRRKRRALLWFFLAAVLVGLFLSLGKNNPLYAILFKYFRFFRHFRRPSRFLVILPLFILYATASGVENLEKFAISRRKIVSPLRKRIRKASLIFIVFCVIYYALFLVFGAASSLFLHSLLILSMLVPIMIASSIFFDIRTLPAGRKILIPGLIAAAIVTAADPVVFVSKSFFITNRHLKREIRFLKSIKKQLPAPHSRVFYSTNPNIPQLVKMSNVGGFVPANLKRTSEYLYTAFHSQIINDQQFTELMDMTFHPLAILLGGRNRMFYSPQVSFRNYSGWDELYREKMENNPMYRMLCPAVTILPTVYYREQDPLPGFWFSYSYRVITDSDGVLKAINKDDFDLKSEVVLMEQPHPGDRDVTGNRSSEEQNSARITHYEPDEIRIALNGSYGWLTLSEIYYPGWEARVDSQPRRIYRGNYIFRTIPIRKGDRELVLRYKPASVKNGMLLSLSTLVLIIIFLIGDAVLKRLKKQ